MSTLKQQTAQGLLWGGMSNGMVQLLGAVFGVVLMNILTPEDYGKMAALVVFSNVASCLQESGFTAALANRKEPTHEEYNAVFWFNIIVGTTIYVILFFAAPFIADFYREPVLCPLARVAFLGFVISSLGTAQRAYLFGHLMVKQTSIVQLSAITVSGIVGVLLALMGFAYWGLALQSLTYVTVITAMSWWFSGWRPTLPIRNTSFVTILRPAWQMFGFSSKLLINSLAFQLNNNAFGVLLTRFFGTHTAGIYSNARKWDDMAIATIGGMVQGVAQPVLREADGSVVVFRKMLRFTCFVSFPSLLGLALISEDFIVSLVGEKWHQSAMLLSLLSVYGAFSPVVTLYSNLVIARGRSTINMTVGLLNCALVWGGIILLHQMHYGLVVMVAYYVVLNIAWLLVWQTAARRLIGLRWHSALFDIAPFFLFSVVVMATSWWLTSSLPLGWLRLILRVLVAVLLYVGSLWVAKAQILRETIQYLLKKHP